MHLPLKRPFFAGGDKSRAHRVVPHVTRFFLVLLTRPHLRVPAILLKDADKRRIPRADEPFPVSRPTTNRREIDHAWHAEEMQVVGHDHVASDQPVRGDAPGFHQNHLHLGRGKDSLPMRRANRHMQHRGLVVTPDRRRMRQMAVKGLVHANLFKTISGDRRPGGEFAVCPRRPRSPSTRLETGERKAGMSERNAETLETAVPAGSSPSARGDRGPHRHGSKRANERPQRWRPPSRRDCSPFARRNLLSPLAGQTTVQRLAGCRGVAFCMGRGVRIGCKFAGGTRIGCWPAGLTGAAGAAFSVAASAAGDSTTTVAGCTVAP